MKYINTGKGQITVLSLAAIWSISLVVDLPGLAITPMMSSLTTIFPHATHLEIQLLSILPNFCIIPFILLSGRLSMSKDKMSLINLGMIVFLLSAVSYFFAKSMTALIVISCFLGIGCGLVIPLAAGIIADYFSGVARMRQMGIKSGIANFSLIIATVVVGWLGSKNWHLSFLVYLIPIIPLCLSPFLSHAYISKTERTAPVAAASAAPAKTAQSAASSQTPSSTPLLEACASNKTRKRTIIGIMAFYLCVTICTIAISYYMPFLMSDYHLSDTDNGVVTAVFFLFITLAGFVLPEMVRLMKNSLTFICMCLMIGGLIIVAIFPYMWTDILAVVAIGFGYGLLQPIFYNKASLLAATPSEATKVISYIMTANYLGTAVTPLVFTGIGQLFKIPGHTYVFWLAIGFLSLVFILSMIYRKSYVFYTSIHDC